MLTELTIRQLGVIEEATFHPGSNLTVVTGETGAGKTMLVLGLGMVSGVRADSSVVRSEQAMATVSARFSHLPPTVVEAVENLGGVLDDGELIVQRQVSNNGRSRTWVGGSTVTQASVNFIGADLVTIHGQSEQVRLSTGERQRQVLDRAAGPMMAKILDTYRAKFEEHKKVVEELEALTESARDQAREMDMLAYGVAEIERIAPHPGEDDALRAEAKRLQDADLLRADAYTSMVALTGDDSVESDPVLSQISVTVKALEHAASQDPGAEVLAVGARELSALATDLASQVSSYLADLDADPIRLEWIETRLAELKGLTRKYGADATEVLAWVASASTRLQELEGSDERLTILRDRAQILDTELHDLAAQMTNLRHQAANDFASKIARELAALAMPHAKVEFDIRTRLDLGPWGADTVSLLFTANPGTEPAPLAKVASGGELSRVRLAIEVVLADSTLKQTFVFDEVDAGIGGAVGLQIGQRLACLATQGQVIVVTHLAQVAAFADTHYVLHKTDDGEVTASGIREVQGNDRLAELARMMGGLDQSASSLAHASELLDQARSMKG